MVFFFKKLQHFSPFLKQSGVKNIFLNCMKRGGLRKNFLVNMEKNLENFRAHLLLK